MYKRQDITGPSVPKIFGVTNKAMGTEEGILPNITHDGIKIMSINLLLPNADDPVIWRGPVISGTVKQFWTDVVWGDLDYLFVDMPPGTGDVPLTVFQSLPVDGKMCIRDRNRSHIISCHLCNHKRKVVCLCIQ